MSLLPPAMSRTPLAVSVLDGDGGGVGGTAVVMESNWASMVAWMVWAAVVSAAAVGA